MKSATYGAAIISVMVAACAPPGYMYDAGSFTPRPIDPGYPPSSPRYAAADQSTESPCNPALRDHFKEQLAALRVTEDNLKQAALRDQGAFDQLMALAKQDRDLQDQIEEACPTR